jgi:soluble lytic murein transglycosylase-like protein
MTPFHRQLPLSRRALVVALLATGSLVGSELAGSPLVPARALDELDELFVAARAVHAPVVELAVSVPAAPARRSTVEPAAYLRDLPFGAEISAVAARHGVDALLVASVIEAESNFRPDAVSDRGALGLMQVMPFHVEDPTLPLDPVENLEIGTAYLASLLERFDGDLALALAGYHAGPGAVDRFGGLPPYASTRHYVTRVLARYEAHLAGLTISGEAGI